MSCIYGKKIKLLLKKVKILEESGGQGGGQNYVTVQATSQTTAATDVLPVSGQAADTIYRVSNWDGSVNNGAGGFDVTKYSEYTWDDVSNPNKYVFLCVNTTIGEVFDISVYNNNAKYADLTAALGTNGVNVPAEIRRGGMSVKFVQSSDNKYVQARCMAQNFTTDVTKWQGVDDEPTANSDNLVKSGGVFDAVTNVVNSERERAELAEQNLQDNIDNIKDETLQENRQMVNSIMENYAPVEITGDVNNAADEEDLTSVNIEGTDVLKFKDKVYNPLVHSGLGRKIIRKNIVNGVNTLTKSMINQPNTIYVIQYDFTLGEDITIPENCVLEFDGGSLSNGTVNLNYGIIQAPLCKILYNAHIVNVGDGIYHSRWYTDYIDGVTDCSAEISNLFSDGDGNIIVIDEGKYKVNLNLVASNNTVIKGASNFRNPKSVFYLHNCEGTFLTLSNYIVIEGIYFDGFNGVIDNFSSTLEKIIDTNSSFSIKISDCSLRGTSYNGAVAINLGSSYFVDIANCSIGQISNGYATIINGSSTTVSFRKVYFNYCRQIIKIENDTIPVDFSDCVFESSYSVGYVVGYASFNNCHVENIGYSVNNIHEGMDYLPGSSTDKIDCMLCCKNAVISFRDSLICDVDPGHYLSKVFRLYPDVDAYSSNGVLTFDNCKFSKLNSNRDKILYIKGNNEGAYANYYKVVINGSDIDNDAKGLIGAIKRFKGCANITMQGVGYFSFNLKMEEGKANVFCPRSSSEFVWPFYLPIEQDDTLYLDGDFFQYPIEYYRVKKLKVCFAQEVQVSNLNNTNIIPVSDTSKIKIGDKFRIDTGISSYFYGSVTEVNSDNIKLNTNITGSGYLYVFAFRPDGDNFGELINMLSVSPRRIGCKCIYQNKLYIQNTSEWVEI